MNTISVISPYKHEGTWVFDDAAKGLVKEAFVAGADTMIDMVTQDIPNAENGFTLYFSAEPFPEYQVKLNWVRPEYSGNIYFWEEFGVEGWLCSSLYKYFDEAPKNLYIKIKPKS